MTTLTTRHRFARVQRAATAVLFVAALGGGLAACSASDAGGAAAVAGEVANESPFDLTTAGQADRPRIEEVPEAVAALKASGFEPVTDGKLTVASNAFTPPSAFFAEDDNKTLLGGDPDIALLVADGLGLEYEPVSVAWADWPLGVESGKYDLVASNVTVTEERKDLFDFATYRADKLSFAVPTPSEVESISEAKDISGLKVYAGSGTNQEGIVLEWIAENEKNGIDPGEIVYFEDDSAARLAMLSGRIDALFQPSVANAYSAAVDGQTKVVGTVPGGYPHDAQIALGTAKGNGLIEPVAIVLNHIIESGDYDAVFERWGLQDDAVTESVVNPAGIPRP
ncbi:polar amino acid transport system substrate-binding protein [Leucobacter exalbidus]|uniref:Polar amino acid transport system substrate-binding protein n=1 Tax=Leucobacter exalbidus TaxID=662960 RepID=A0A940T1P4_9MICO|nr:ABC transporter substrate-binding protein [Leucobacter exalbidus]MBP1327060.1 polar amino acid transport system substrate-binding protein [Leucobacter exalbidus]